MTKLEELKTKLDHEKSEFALFKKMAEFIYQSQVPMNNFHFWMTDEENRRSALIRRLSAEYKKEQENQSKI